MMDFSGSAGAASSFDTIPLGQLAWCNLSVRGVKASGSGGEYIDCELVVDQGQPYAGRKFWEMIGNPHHQGNSEKYRQMGMIAVTRILEAGRNAGPHNPAGYKINSFQELDGLRVPVKIGIEEGTGGHEDKNRVAEWLTPNPASKSGHKWFKMLVEGIFNATAQPGGGQAAGGFGQSTGGFGNAGGSAAASGAEPAATTGFGAAGGAPSTGFGQTPPANSAQSGGAGNGAATAGFGSQQAGATASPSDPGKPGNWLEQANGGAPQ